METKWAVAFGCSLALGAIETQVQAQQQPIVVMQQDPNAQGQVYVQQPGPPGQQVYTTQSGGTNGQPTVIVVQGGQGSFAPIKRHSLAAEEGQPPPPGYHLETTNIRGLWIAGVSLLAAGYGSSIFSGLVVGVIDDANGNSNGGSSAAYGFIPLAGPWIYVADPNVTGPGKPWFGFLGVMQLAGAGMLIGGLAAHTNVWVSDTAKNNDYTPEFMVGPGTIGLRGKF